MNPKELLERNLLQSMLKTMLKAEDITENYYSLHQILKNIFQELLHSKRHALIQQKMEKNSLTYSEKKESV
jgi:hypothetical protein